jgi:rubrerythrin
MKSMTKANLEAAFAGESQAHMRYLIFADLAEREGLANVARLFRAASYAEQMHATAHFRALGGAGKTVDNLGSAFGGETFEITEMYPAYLAVAELQGEKKAQGSMSDALAAEKIHAELYSQAQLAASGGKDVVMGKVWVCGTCGFTMEGEAPERCPVCGTIHTKFREF